MATLERIGTSWCARVRRKAHKPLTKTFRTQAQADVWATQREAEMARAEIVSEAGSLTVCELINSYRHLRDKARPMTW
ncbi:hypothetical protein [Lacisediminimonas sp.]|uniref:hypothetical protein n=1 Tax=Lacisediminimonas sp. TaxID=3060582 RepID=UPI002719BC53|nr:hypothetical protein [Lacisediminimonas sp.]MDO8299354.1 hypothetical protein [Lacisediminimonas sp.]